MTLGGRVEIRRLTARDRSELSVFSCRDFREPWSDLIEETVRDRLADELEVSSNVTALGLWVDQELCALAVWRMDAGATARVCHSLLVAVRMGHQRRGHARKLKEELLAHAKQAGATAVVSTVHWDNDAMIELNVSLGANVERIPGDPDHCYCVIPLVPTSD